MSDPFKITEPTVVSFSGGRTSAYMLWRVLQSNNGLPKEAKVIFCNTGKEVEETLKFVRDCEINWKVKIDWVEYRSESPGYAFVNFETASRNGEPFEQLILKKQYLPNTFARFCTQELKINLIKKIFPYEDFVTFVGIRFDEPRRVAKMKNNKDLKETPLASAKIGKKEIDEFWKKQSFNLNLVTINGNALLGNCDLCFMKKASHKINLVKDNPSRAVWWAHMEKIIGNKFRPEHPSYAEMHKFSQNQIDMFVDESIACFCGD